MLRSSLAFCFATWSFEASLETLVAHSLPASPNFFILGLSEDAALSRYGTLALATRRAAGAVRRTM